MIRKDMSHSQIGGKKCAPLLPLYYPNGLRWREQKQPNSQTINLSQLLALRLMEAVMTLSVSQSTFPALCVTVVINWFGGGRGTANGLFWDAFLEFDRCGHNLTCSTMNIWFRRRAEMRYRMNKYILHILRFQTGNKLNYKLNELNSLNDWDIKIYVIVMECIK
jgi:hypothetical protein